MPICPPSIVSGKWRRSRPPDLPAFSTSFVDCLWIPLWKFPFARVRCAPLSDCLFIGHPGFGPNDLWRGSPLRLCRLGGRGSVRGSPCGEPARLAAASLCPPFFLLRGYPRERISFGSGAPPLLRRLRRTLPLRAHSRTGYGGSIRNGKVFLRAADE